MVSHRLRGFWRVVIAVFVIMSSMPVDALASDVFVIAVGSDAQGFDDDSGISAAGDETPSDVVVFINGNPVADYRSGGVFKQINHYLKDGMNSIHLRGSSENSLFVKIGLMAGAEFRRVVAKREFKPAEVAQRVRLEFTADIPYRLPIFEAQNRIPPAPAAGALHALLQRLADSLAGHDYDGAAALLLEQTGVWRGMSYGGDEADFALLQQQAAAHYRSSELTYRAPSADTIKVIAGESVLMVYSEVADNGFVKTRTLGEFVVAGSEAQPAPAMQMVFIDGEWQFWE